MPSHAALQSPASMKVPPKRKGNAAAVLVVLGLAGCLNESPSEKEGKFRACLFQALVNSRLNESPSEKEGKSGLLSCSR